MTLLSAVLATYQSIYRRGYVQVRWWNITDLVGALTFPGSRWTIEEIAATVGDPSRLIPVLHTEKLTGVGDQGVQNATLKDNRVERSARLAFAVIPVERMISSLDACGYKRNTQSKAHGHTEEVWIMTCG